jgi:hypothetical protein
MGKSEKQMKLIQKKEKKIAVFLLFIMLISLIPLYVISGYAHPSVDDYSYGTHASRVWQATGSFFQVISDAWQRTGHTYETWQGTFSSVFLMRLEPAVFGEQYYFLTTVVLLSTFLICSILFYMAFFSKLFHASFAQGIILSLVLTLGAVEFTHVISDSFYWYNGGITYTFFYSMEALLFALMLYLYCAKKKPVKIILGIISIPLAFFTCGGNYVTSLVTVEILFFACFLLYFRHNTILSGGLFRLRKIFLLTGNSKNFPSKEKKEIKNWEPKERNIETCFFTFLFLSALAGFLTAVTAPGNAVRQAEVGSATNPFLSIILSFFYGAYSMGNCFKLPVVILFLFCIPIFARISQKSNITFRYPGIVTALSFCLYSSQITPVIYAQGLKIPYRIMNIIYFSCFVMTAVNLFYWIGYFAKKEQTKIIIEKINYFYETYLLQFCMISLILFCFASIAGISIQADVDADGSTQIEITQMPATVSAMYSFLTGEAQQYDSEAWERYAIYTDSSQNDITVNEFSVKPDIIFHSDITENPKNWKNKCVKKYFRKKSVKIQKIGTVQNVLELS